jgi:8-oxo-dGTP pyrophosphatase MutT (NUDIX family)
MTQVSKKIRTLHQLTENVKLLQKVVLRHNGQILILKREANSYSRPECWDLPGGNSEWPVDGQSGHGQYARDATREVREETGVTVPTTAFIPDNLIWFNTYFDADKQVFSIICGWIVDLPATDARPEVSISHEHTAYAWVTEAELSQYDFGGTKGEFVAETVRAALAQQR